jgi:hypothetical protein
MKTVEKSKVGAHFLARSTWGVGGGRGACWSSGMGLGRMTNTYSLTQTCTKPTSWLVHYWSTFGARMNHNQIQIHKTHHGSDLGEATTFPLTVHFVPLHKAHIQMTFGLGTPKLLKLRFSHLWGPITLCVNF